MPASPDGSAAARTPCPDDPSSAITPRASAVRVGVLAAALGFAPALALGEAETFALLPGSMMNDDSGTAAFEGTLGHARGMTYQVVQGYAIAEGDMVLGRIDPTGRLEVPFQRRGLGVSSNFERWPDGIVPYAFHPALSDVQLDNVERAIAMLREKTRIELVPTDDPLASRYDDYLFFEPSGGCASFVGRQGDKDAQSVWVSDACSAGNVAHEIAHAIGLYHEHTRPDRDNYVQIDWDVIAPGSDHNFEIFDAGTTMYGDYDYGSIMHYGETSFSRNGKPTILPPPNRDIGQRVALSAGDIEAIDRMYATDVTLDASVIETERGVEIDLSIANIGELGAADLVLRIRGDDGADWTSISADSGWDCLDHRGELRCERPRLVEQGSSRFTVIADAATTGTASLAFLLESRTLDLDPSSNGINAAAFDDQTSVAQPLLGGASGGVDELPESGNRSTGDPFDRNGAPSYDSDGGGGSGGGAPAPLALLALATLAVGRRARREADPSRPTARR